MIRDEILNMAREAGAEPESLNIFDASTTARGWSFGADELERFAAIVAAAEREACAKVCQMSDRYRGDYFASIIRARGKT